MSLAEHVRTLGRGPGRSRSLTQDEAADAMTTMLSGKAAPEAIGALLMLMRMKGETAEEIAGFAQAASAVAPLLPAVDLDWPSYAAGRTRGAPWFLLSAKLVAQAGFRVLLHGWNGADGQVRGGLAEAGIAAVTTASEAKAALDRDNIAYMPLEAMHPQLFALLRLRDVLGLRSCINTVSRMLNPAGATASVQGVFHPSYRLLQADAAALLGLNGLTVIKGGGGEFERSPAKAVEAFGLRDGVLWDTRAEATSTVTRRLSDSALNLSDAAHLPAFETQIVTGTAALALSTLGQPEALAQDLWNRQAAPTAA